MRDPTEQRDRNILAVAQLDALVDSARRTYREGHDPRNYFGRYARWRASSIKRIGRSK